MAVGDGMWASGRWQVKEGKDEEFIERWKAWIGSTSQDIAGFRMARLLRSVDDRLRFTSVSEWSDDASLKAWKSSPGFAQGLESTRALCDEFVGGDFDVAASFSSPGT